MSSLMTKESHCGIKITGERTALTDQQIHPQNIIATFNAEGQIIQNNFWVMGKHLKSEDAEQYEIKHFHAHVNATQSEKESPTETKKRRHSTDPKGDDQEPMEASRKRSVKHKVTVEFNGPTTMEEFNNDFKEAYLDKDMDKEEAKKEFASSKKEFRELLERYGEDP